MILILHVHLCVGPYSLEREIPLSPRAWLTVIYSFRNCCWVVIMLDFSGIQQVLTKLAIEKNKRASMLCFSVGPMDTVWSLLLSSDGDLRGTYRINPWRTHFFFVRSNAFMHFCALGLWGAHSPGRLWTLLPWLSRKGSLCRSRQKHAVSVFPREILKIWACAYPHYLYPTGTHSFKWPIWRGFPQLL